MQKQQKLQQHNRTMQVFNMNSILAIMLLALCGVAAAKAVPTSVLVQDTELATTNAANNNNYNKNNHIINNKSNKDNNNNLLTKVKRASMPLSSAPSSQSSLGLNKKSSPEVLPASFNAPPPQPSPQQQLLKQQQQQQQQAQTSSSSGGVGSATIMLPANGEIINTAIAAGLTAAVEAAANQHEWDQQQQQQQQPLYNNANSDFDNLYEDTPTLLHKRGISSQQQQYLYGGNSGIGNGASLSAANYGSTTDFYNPYLTSSRASSASGLNAAVPSGVWSDDMDPSVVYTDLQELDDYAPNPQISSSSYRNKAYDNLQNLLNAEAYLEPIALPSQYPNRYYSAGMADAERNKRSNINNKYNPKYVGDMRLKRDTKLTPADMLALVALVEAGERARKDTDTEPSYMYPAESTYQNPKPYNNNPYNAYASQDYPTAMEDVDYSAGGAWLEPNVVDYYGVPVNVEALPKYEMPREHKYNMGGGVAGVAAPGSRYSSKRYMVAKKKRSLGKFNLNAEKYF